MQDEAGTWDRHEGSRLAQECETPGKSKAKIKAHLLVRRKSSRIWLGKEGYSGLLPRTEVAPMVSKVKLALLSLEAQVYVICFGH